MGIATFLNDRPPTRLRGLLWLALTDVGQVATRTSTSDAGGGATETWVSGPDIPCRVDPLTSSETEVADRLSDRSTHLITTPPDTVVTSNDRFVITGRGTFEVTVVRVRTGQGAQLFEAVQVS